jgi:hypothetical protein
VEENIEVKIDFPTIKVPVTFVPIKNVDELYDAISRLKLLLPDTAKEDPRYKPLFPTSINASFYQVLEGEGKNVKLVTKEIGTRCNPIQKDDTDPCERSPLLGGNSTCEAVDNPASDLGLKFYKETCLFNETCKDKDKSERFLCEETCSKLYEDTPDIYDCSTNSLGAQRCERSVFLNRCINDRCAQRDEKGNYKDVKCNYTKPCLISQASLLESDSCNNDNECASQNCVEYGGEDINLNDDQRITKKICAPVFQCVRKCSGKGEQVSTAGCCPGLIEDGGQCLPVNIDGIEPYIKSYVSGSCNIKMWDASGNNVGLDQKLDNGEVNLERLLTRNVFLGQNFLRSYEWLFATSSVDGNKGDDRWGFNKEGRKIALDYSKFKSDVRKMNLGARKSLAEKRCRYLAQKSDGSSDEEFLGKCLEDNRLNRPFTIEGSPVASSNLSSATAVYLMFAEEALEDAKYYEFHRKYFGVKRTDENKMVIESEDKEKVKPLVARLYTWSNYVWDPKSVGGHDGSGKGFDQYGNSDKWIAIKKFWIKIFKNIAGDALIPGIRNKFCVQSCWRVPGGKIVDALYNPEFVRHQPAHLRVSYYRKFEEQVTSIAEHFKIEDLLMSPAYAARLGGGVSYDNIDQFSDEKQMLLLLERMKSLYKIWSDEIVGEEKTTREALLPAADDLLQVFSDKTELGKKLRDQATKDETLKSLTPEMRTQYLQHYIGSQALALWSRYGSTNFPGYNLKDSVSDQTKSALALGGGGSGFAASLATGGAANLTMGALAAIGGFAQGGLDSSCAYASNGAVKGKATSDIYYNARYIGEFYREYAKAKQDQYVCYMKLAGKMNDNYDRNQAVNIEGSKITIPRAPNISSVKPEERVAIDHTCKTKNCVKAPGAENNVINGINLGGTFGGVDGSASSNKNGEGELDSGSLGSSHLGAGKLGSFAIGQGLEQNSIPTKDVRDSFDKGVGRRNTGVDLLKSLAKSKNPDMRNLAKILSANSSSGVGRSLNIDSDVSSIGLGSIVEKNKGNNAFDQNKYLSDMQNANGSKAGFNLNKFGNNKDEKNPDAAPIVSEDEKGGAHGLANEEVDRIMDATKRHSLKFLSDPEDDIFKKISKTYVRTAYPVLLIKKKD